MISLRPLGPEDSTFLDPWLPTAAASVAHEATTAAGLLARAKRTPTLHLRIIERDHTPAGLLIYNLHTPTEDSAIFELIATPPRAARRGTGMTAATIAEEDFRAANIHTAYAPAAAKHGIGMYFWIRLGYAPQLRPQWPCTCEGIAWLRRDLT